MSDPEQGVVPAHLASEAARSESPFAIGLVLRRAHDRAAAQLLTALRPHGLELRHFAVLMALSAGPTTQRDLVARSGSDKASMVRVIDDLEAGGLAERRPFPGDRRVHMIEMTPTGEAVFSAVHREAQDIPRQLFEHMEPGQGELLLSLLTRFADPESSSTQRRPSER